MGKKITVDSATLMNKGLEFIEAMHLYGASPEQIEILVHPQSIVHSMVEFTDGAVLAQLSVPDMRLPIQYALTYPERAPSLTAPLDLIKIGALTFEGAGLCRLSLSRARAGDGKNPRHGLRCHERRPTRRPSHFSDGKNTVHRHLRMRRVRAGQDKKHRSPVAQ